MKITRRKDDSYTDASSSSIDNDVEWVELDQETDVTTQSFFWDTNVGGRKRKKKKTPVTSISKKNKVCLRK